MSLTLLYYFYAKSFPKDNKIRSSQKARQGNNLFFILKLVMQFYLMKSNLIINDS